MTYLSKTSTTFVTADNVRAGGVWVHLRPFSYLYFVLEIINISRTDSWEDIASMIVSSQLPKSLVPYIVFPSPTAIMRIYSMRNICIFPSSSIYSNPTLRQEVVIQLLDLSTAFVLCKSALPETVCICSWFDAIRMFWICILFSKLPDSCCSYLYRSMI